MRLALVSPPLLEPVSVDEAKLYLRLVTDADDVEVAAAITSARIVCELATTRSFVETGWILFLDSFPYAGIMVPRADLLDVEELAYIATDGSDQVLDPSSYKFSTGSPGRIVPAFGHSWPSARQELDSIRVKFTAGYGPSAADVPVNVKQAIKLTMAYLYENRGDSTIEPPQAARDLMAPDIWGHYA